MEKLAPTHICVLYLMANNMYTQTIGIIKLTIRLVLLQRGCRYTAVPSCQLIKRTCSFHLMN